MVPDSYTSTRWGAWVALARLAAVLGSPIPTKHTTPSRRARDAATVIISSEVKSAVVSTCSVAGTGPVNVIVASLCSEWKRTVALLERYPAKLRERLQCGPASKPTVAGISDAAKRGLGLVVDRLVVYVDDTRA